MTTQQPDPLSQRLAACYTGVLHDVMRAAGMRNFVLPRQIHPLDATTRLAGPVFTVEGQPTPAPAHDTLLAWTNLLSRAPSGHVLVIQPNDHHAAFMGELSAETLQYKGLTGALVDGGCRDTAFILELGFPVWCRHTTPVDVVGSWLPEQFGQPVVIGEVTLHTGDYLCADRDGAIVLPGALADEIVREAETAIGKENKVRTAILAGVDPQEAYLQHGKF